MKKMKKEINWIIEYNNWIKDNPNKVCKKVKTIYERLAKEVNIENEVTFTNKATGEVETHTYVFDEKNKKQIEQFCENARTHAKTTHDAEKNYQKLILH